MKSYIFESERLGFRTWRDSDREAFSDLSSDSEIMKYYTNLLNEEESNDLIDRFKTHMAAKGFGAWAVEIKETGEFIGCIGFLTVVFDAKFAPCVEIGWKLDKKYWHEGYATEGGLACLEYGFENLGFDTIYSFTASVNQSSINVMKRIGMTYQYEFEHPRVSPDSELKTHVLYKITK